MVLSELRGGGAVDGSGMWLSVGEAGHQHGAVGTDSGGPRERLARLSRGHGQGAVELGGRPPGE